MTNLVDYALTTVDDVKENLGLASSDYTKDNLIRRKINQATDLIQTYTGRNFKLQQYTEYYDGSQIDEMVLKQRPIVTDGTHEFLFERRDTSLNDDDFETIESDLYFSDANSGVLELNFNSLGRWNRYRITYWAGYDTGDVPNDLSEAAATLAAYLVQNPSGANIGVMMKREGQREVRYANASLTLANLLANLGIDETINAYSNLPVLTDG